ncbi:MAG: 4Fe-4S binding protein [Peptococcaceae bacterium]|nr:4Fe-4S binding protein [Peptococcaceae bacterium]
MKIKRQIVKIDEEKCTGCGLCVSPCAEGAIEIRDGKAKVIRDELCDGAGFCLGVCPEGALTLEDREAELFSEEAVHRHIEENPRVYIAQHCFRCGRSEEDSPVFPCRKQGQALWVCTRCLPALIHG